MVGYHLTMTGILHGYVRVKFELSKKKRVLSIQYRRGRMEIHIWIYSCKYKYNFNRIW